MQFNKNTHGKHINIKDGTYNEEKKLIGVSSIFSLMCMNGYYDSAYKENETKEQIINIMLDNAKTKVNHSESSGLNI